MRQGPVVEKLQAMMRRPGARLALGAPILALLGAAGAAGYWYFATPTRFTVAVAPRGGDEARLMQAYARALEAERADVRLDVVELDDLRASAEALSSDRVDLAVVRPDVGLPGNGLTLAILREEALVLAAPQSAGIEDVAGLQGKRLGVVARHESDAEVIRRVLAHHDLAPPAVGLVPIPEGDVEGAFRAKRIDAVAFLAVPGGPEAAGVMRAASRAASRKTAVIPVEEADALSLEVPAFSSIALPPVSLGGRPLQPDDEIKTVAVSTRLVGRSSLDRGPVSELVRHLFQLRSRVAQTAASVNLLKAPDADTATSAALPNHQGAIDYYNREQLTFMDRYGDWVWMALFFGGGISSAAAWVARLFVRRRRELVDEVLDRLLCILSEARTATTPAELEERAAEVDALVSQAVRYARHSTTGTRTMGALILAIDAARGAVDDRRRKLREGSSADGAAGGGEPAPRRISAAASARA